MSPLTKNQAISVLKALAYSFVSTFVVALPMFGELNEASLMAAAIAGVNAALVTLKKLFTTEE